jgi:hypothetical protein
MPLAKLLAKLVRMSEYKKRRLRSELDRVGIEKEPEAFLSENMSRSIWAGVIGLVFIPAGMPFISIMLVIYAIMLYQKKNNSLRSKIAKMNRDIETELPRMVETLNFTLGDNNDLLKFFERYRRVAGESMGKALDRLILDMKTGNAEDALRAFDKTLVIPQISTLVSTLLGITHGIDQRTTLIVLEKDFRSRQRELLRREIDKRPRKVRTASVILTFSMVILMMVPLFVMIFQTLGEAGVT